MNERAVCELCMEEGVTKFVEVQVYGVLFHACEECARLEATEIQPKGGELMLAEVREKAARIVELVDAMRVMSDKALHFHALGNEGAALAAGSEFIAMMDEIQRFRRELAG